MTPGYSTWPTAAADFLVTGDKRAGLLSRKRIGTARILTAAAFCRDALRERR
jgi:predicted nucleic acid-binding protein